MKRFAAILMALVLTLSLVCTAGAEAPAKKLSVVSTIFPQYDWVRQVIGDKADAYELTLLLDKGVDLHSYQPTVDDLVKVSNADVFIYVGGESDVWVEAALENAANPNMIVINLLDALGDAVKEEELVEGMEHEHEHEHEEEELTANDIQDRPLSDFAGTWMSLQPMMAAGQLDAFCEHKAEDDENATAADYRAKYTAGWMCDAVTITITDSTIAYNFADGTSTVAEYIPAGYSIKFDEHGDIASVRYQYETSNEAAPRYVQFNDHGHEPAAAEHFHVYFGNDGFDAMMASATNPYFAPADLDVDGVLDMLMGHNHEHHHDEEEAELDEHVWLSLRNAKALTEVIADALCELDPANAYAYKANAAAYAAQLSELDSRYQAAVANAGTDTVLFGDRFPFRYLVDDYGLSYFAAFAGCSAEAEASFETIVFLTGKVNELGLKAVCVLEGSDCKIANTVIRNTNTKDQIIVMFDSLQSVTAQDVAGGITYLKVMESNLEALTEALK